MDGIHDLGGMHGFGPVEMETGPPRFHAPWEGRVVGIFVPLLIQGWFNIDAFRHGIEVLEPVFYLRAPYFERWRSTVVMNLIAAGVLTAEEVEARIVALREGRAPAPARPLPPLPQPPEPGFVREVDSAPRFATGARVRARDLHPRGHTRLPRYARGRRGRVEHVHPAFVFPDTNAHGEGEQPQYLYTVRFDGRELWGDTAEPGHVVNLDLFESYLEPA